MSEDETDRLIHHPEPELSPAERRRQASLSNLAKARAARGKGKGRKAAAPSVDFDFTQTPQFQAAVAAAAEKATAKAVAEIMAVHGITASSPSSSEPIVAEARNRDDPTTQILSRLALEMARLSDPGRKTVSPEVQQARDEANRLMWDQIEATRESGQKPEYTLIGTVYLDDELLTPQFVGPDHVMRNRRIAWDGAPSEGMRPANAAAERIWNAYVASIGGGLTAVNQVDRPRVNVLTRDQEVPQVGKPRRSGVEDISASKYEYTEVRILGTKHPSARQSI